jgi:hypothetical protein
MVSLNSMAAGPVFSHVHHAAASNVSVKELAEARRVHRGDAT